MNCEFLQNVKIFEIRVTRIGGRYIRDLSSWHMTKRDGLVLLQRRGQILTFVSYLRATEFQNV